MTTKYKLNTKIRNYKKEFIIRKATIKDLADIQRLNFDLFKKEYKEFDKSLNLKWTYSNVAKKYFSWRINGKKDGFVEVVQQNGNVIGYICGGLQDRMDYMKEGIYAEAENMLINEKFRGKGLGGKLVKDFLKWCKIKKVNHVFVRASVQNKLGIDFYRGNGFEEYDLILKKKLK